MTSNSGRESGQQGRRGAKGPARLVGGVLVVVLVAIGSVAQVANMSAGATTASTSGTAQGSMSSAAQQPVINTPRGFVRPIGYHPPTQPGLAPVAPSSTNPSCSTCNPPLLFTANRFVGGGFSGTPGHVTITPIFWAPSPTYSFNASYKTVIDGYLANVAAASGTNGNVFSVADEFYQNVGSGNQSITYHVASGAEVDATDPYPAEGSSWPASCTAETGFGLTACVTDSALQTEVSSVLSLHGLPTDDSHMYMVFFPPNVQTCGAGLTYSLSNCSFSGYTPTVSGGSYCGYHSEFGTISAAKLYRTCPIRRSTVAAGERRPTSTRKRRDD